MKNLTRGVLITLEGIDGSGKSTAAKALFDHFHQQNLRTVLTKEPGGTQLGKVIRTVVQEKTAVQCPEAEYLLFAADRAQHFAEIVLPALAKNTIVISDRMADSSLAYQGYGRGLDHTIINTVNAWAMRQRMPDLVLYLRISPETAMNRIMQRKLHLTAFEQEKSFQQHVYQGFEAIFAQKKNGRIIDAEQRSEEVIQQVIQTVETWLKSQNIIST